jgi:hypothetical protein
MKKILVILFLFFTLSAFSQNIIVKTNNITYLEYKADTLYEQSVIYDTTTTFIINSIKYEFKINNIIYPISEVAYNQPNNVYVYLIEWSKGKFVNILYYPDSGLIMIKYLMKNTIIWYYPN